MTSIQKAQARKAIGQGRVHLTSSSLQPHRKTISNYQAVLANTSGISVVNKVIPKTNTRYTAEHSLISSMVLIMIVAVTHFDVSSEPLPALTKEVSEASDGVKLFYDLVSKAHNNLHIHPIRPELILSTDDYILRGWNNGFYFRHCPWA